jgi:hypothetical protein
MIGLQDSTELQTPILVNGSIARNRGPLLHHLIEKRASQKAV